MLSMPDSPSSYPGGGGGGGGGNVFPSSSPIGGGGGGGGSGSTSSQSPGGGGGGGGESDPFISLCSTLLEVVVPPIFHSQTSLINYLFIIFYRIDRLMGDTISIAYPAKSYSYKMECEV